jgi:hypothetical protein
MNASTITELAISTTTLASAWLTGNKNVWGMRLGLIANLMWWYYVIAFQRWGMIPMQIFFLFICTRNLIKWEKEK